MATVRLHRKLLFLTTKSLGWVNVKSGEPWALICSFRPLASIVMVKCAFGCLIAALKSGFKSEAALSAPTAIMQSPVVVRCFSVVVINVVG